MAVKLAASFLPVTTQGTAMKNASKISSILKENYFDESLKFQNFQLLHYRIM